jgi:hypothetical protein
MHTTWLRLPSLITGRQARPDIKRAGNGGTEAGKSQNPAGKTARLAARHARENTVDVFSFDAFNLAVRDRRVVLQILPLGVWFPDTMDQRCGAFDRQDRSVHPRGAAPRNAHTVNERTLASFSKH